MNSSREDAQRELEQRALRNVRNLVDRMEHDDQADRRTQKRILVSLLVGAIVVAGALAAAMVLMPAPPGRSYEVQAPASKTRTTP